MNRKVIYLGCFVLVCLITVLCFLLLKNGVKNNHEFLRYPGNGIPYLSSDKNIDGLNEEIKSHSKQLKNIESLRGKIIFKDINNFKYSSSKRIEGKRFCLKTGVTINGGECQIGIGNLKYIIKSMGVIIYDGDKIIYRNDVEQIRNIIVEVFSKENISTRFYSNKRLLKILKVHINTPASIHILLTNGCSGYIGPWVWLRGYI